MPWPIPQQLPTLTHLHLLHLFHLLRLPLSLAFSSAALSRACSISWNLKPIFSTRSISSSTINLVFPDSAGSWQRRWSVPAIFPHSSSQRQVLIQVGWMAVNINDRFRCYELPIKNFT